ncbi:hypothetical protein SARC_02144 [Sphaeroforma arctica JP610]|uniref:FYVE-type domain-containing protein n=1 Tax=Sphaeroforma arctica JP610 TaxID=667725 RepID=A0A0L0G9L8_9EUKA|nr:hypothetical protein SARC_02144 [Sphaeroforma arctica JP610]KNC85695.1 hypothetical protein SARC_02144 [Sphaeroforma arctica JP610]|eukprot:XP_014159597.1 hypothetical protein SARC_02144 [Sphaeroforma arctica JP610]
MVSVEVVHEVQGHINNVTCAKFLPKDQVFITGSEDQSLRVWVMRENGVWWPCSIEFLDSSITCLDFDTESRTLVVGTANGVVMLYSVSKDFNTVERVSVMRAHTGNVCAVAANGADGFIASCGDDYLFQVHSISSKQRLGQYKAAVGLKSMCLVCDENTNDTSVYVGTDGGEILALSVSETGTVSFGPALDGHKSAVTSLAYANSCRTLISGSQDKLVGLWKLDEMSSTSSGTSTPISVRPILLHKHTAPVTSVTYSSLTNEALTVDAEGMCCIWDMSVEREPPVTWHISDMCELCEKPFFWKVQETPVSVGSFNFSLPKFNVNRQHHCRQCGKAACINCVPHKILLTKNGYEVPVYVCRECFPALSPDVSKPTVHVVKLKDMCKVECMGDSDQFTAVHKDFAARVIKFEKNSR